MLTLRHFCYQFPPWTYINTSPVTSVDIIGIIIIGIIGLIKLGTLISFKLHYITTKPVTIPPRPSICLWSIERSISCYISTNHPRDQASLSAINKHYEPKSLDPWSQKPSSTYHFNLLPDDPSGIPRTCSQLAGLQRLMQLLLITYNN